MTKKLAFISLLLLFSISCSHFANKSDNKIRIVHYNIKELDSEKIQKFSRFPNLEQLRSAAKTLRELDPDILSINEMQYDRPGVPTTQFRTEGKNIKQFAKLSGLSLPYYSFDPANTGENAKKLENNYYPPMGFPNWIEYADLVNFGMFPGQYSSGALSKYKVRDKVVISKLTWKQFNPQIDLSQFADAKGNPLPEDIELFDKNFSDITLKIQGKDVHLVLLHTVPAFGFGNKNTPNFLRNRDQLAFLKWYLTGQPERPDLDIKPLNKETRFIAMGDWNIDYKKEQGGEIIKSLMTQFQPWLENPNSTYIGDNFSQNTDFSATLDYILLSHHFKILNSGILSPDPPLIIRSEICGNKRNPAKRLAKNRYRVDFKNSKNLHCSLELDEKSYRLHTGSDHLPIFAEVILTN